MKVELLKLLSCRTAMKATIPVYVTLLFVLLAYSVVEGKNATAPTKNLRAFLTDTSLVTRQINCVLGRAKCDRIGGQLKKAIPEVVNRNCARCTNAQASNANKLITFIRNHYPVAYRDIINKYRSNKAGHIQQAQRPKKNAKPNTSSASQAKSTARNETSAPSLTKQNSSS